MAMDGAAAAAVGARVSSATQPRVVAVPASAMKSRSGRSNKSVGSISNTFDMIVGAYPGGDFYKGDMDELTFTIGSVATVPPTAAFTITPTSGKAPLKVSFKDTSTNSPSKWDWDFGDGSTSTSQSPSHTYDKPGDYTATLTVTNAAGSDTTTSHVTVTDPDDKPPTGTFSIGPATGWARGTPVTLTQTSLSDDKTPGGSIRRSVNWHDGSIAAAWSAGTRITHVFGRAGTFAPTVTLTDLGGNIATVTTPSVTVRTDTTAPVTGLLRPADRSSSSAWRVLKGRDSDGQSGVAWVHVSAIEKRGGAWYAYRPATHSWVKAGSRAAALRKSRAGRAILARAGVGASPWTFHRAGVRTGVLVVRVVAADRSGNRSRTLSYSQRLTRS
jgi:PKD repeat protein